MNHAAHGTHPHHVHADHKPLNTCKNNHSMMDDHHSMMQMSFHGGFVETILFEPWKTTSITIFIASWVFIFILAVLHQGLKEFLQCPVERQIRAEVISKEEDVNELEPMNTEAPTQEPKQIDPRYPTRFLYSLLYIAYLLLGYVLMLIVMTLNIYLFLAIILGLGTGHWLYTWSCFIPSVDTDQSVV